MAVSFTSFVDFNWQDHLEASSVKIKTNGEIFKPNGLVLVGFQSLVWPFFPLNCIGKDEKWRN